MGGNFLAFGVFTGEDPTNRMVTFKVAELDESQVRTALAPVVEKITDIRSR